MNVEGEGKCKKETNGRNEKVEGGGKGEKGGM